MITWLWYHLTLVPLDVGTTWLRYHLTLVSLDFEINWLWNHLTSVSIDFGITSFWYHLTLVSLDFGITWLWYHLTWEKKLFQLTGCRVAGSDVSVGRAANLHQATGDWTLRNPFYLIGYTTWLRSTTWYKLREIGLWCANRTHCMYEAYIAILLHEMELKSTCFHVTPHR